MDDKASQQLIDGVVFTPLQRIATPNGEVRHGLKADEAGFVAFGEAYFSEVLPSRIKGWKRHTRMTMNLVVVAGTIRFIVVDSSSNAASAAVILSVDDPKFGPYGRLTVAPNVWMAFEGLGQSTNLLLNIASHGHDPTEAQNCDIGEMSQYLSISNTRLASDFSIR